MRYGRNVTNHYCRFSQSKSCIIDRMMSRFLSMAGSIPQQKLFSVFNQKVNLTQLQEIHNIQQKRQFTGYECLQNPNSYFPIIQIEMVIIGDALRQAFMAKHEYQSLREEEKAWEKLQKPLISLAVTLISLAVLISTVITLKIVFPDDNMRRPFCRDLRIQPLSINFTTAAASGGGGGGESDLLPGAFVLTDQETVDYYWMVVFVPSALVFAASMVYLIAGITVAYTAPVRHGCLKVVENNYCASRRGGVRCLAILNVVFAVTFGLLALFLGSTLLTLGSGCSLPLFWCYEIASWGLVILHGGAAFFLRRKAAVILDETDFAGRDIGLEMLEVNTTEVTPDVERRVTEGFKAWMGPSFLSSDEEEDEPDGYLEVPNVTRSNSTRQRM